MKFPYILLLATSFLISAPTAFAEEQWGYSGNISPEYWGNISPKFTECKQGKSQSPVNIVQTSKLHTQHLTFHYQLTTEHIVNNTHTIQVIVNSDKDYIIFHNKKYYLKQFHFHTPSEHHIHGVAYPLEIHFVHADKDGHLLVLAVMAEEGMKKNPELEKAWNVVSPQPNKEEVMTQPFNINNFLPKDTSYFHYTGSLTTPPCLENVTWIVLKQPVQVSEDQVDRFETLMKHDNNRHVQPLNGRKVDED